jgi:isopenicillin-N N-acyltransferase-like protein
MLVTGKFYKQLGKIAVFVILFFSILFLLFLWRIRVPDPRIESTKNVSSYKRIQLGVNHYSIGNNWLKKNKAGIWEMYLEGSPYERGLIYGILSKELMEQQEIYFVRQIKEMIPGTFFLQILKGFVGWFNRDIYKYIPEENLQEIYGISQSFSDQFNFIGPKYYRILNYHAAHDIGHALTDLNMVGCTSFSVNNALSSDSTLLIGRNFDFYMGDDFAKDKLVVFIHPDQGYNFVSYGWAGFTGVVSGMNEKGITVTLNAAKSDIPYMAKEPISLLAREILQYASTIEEAYQIAKRRETFVSESLMIGSAWDQKTVIIEKSPQKIDLFDSKTDLLTCSNHYQSEAFALDSANLINIRDSDSQHRFDRMVQLIHQQAPINIPKAAQVLRDQKGVNDTDLGMGNPKALNQLIAHHSILMKPEERKLWISTSPYQLGPYMGYDLNKVFQANGQFVATDSIASDPFLQTQAYQKYAFFKKTRQQINKFVSLGIPFQLTAAAELQFKESNPTSYLTYLSLGNYFQKTGKETQAIFYWRQALQHAVASNQERMEIENKVKNMERKALR